MIHRPMYVLKLFSMGQADKICKLEVVFKNELGSKCSKLKENSGELDKAFLDQWLVENAHELKWNDLIDQCEEIKA